MFRRRRPALALLLLAASVAPSAAQAQFNDYPTAARADYVFACMATNGQTQDALNRCSCSIDVIATLLPYDRYVQAETIMRMRLMGGEKSTVFKTGAAFKTMVDDLKNAQVEAEIRCF